MKDRNPPTSHERVALVVHLPTDDHGIYVEARRILRCLMGRKAPTLETLLLHDLRGREATGIADNYLDAIRWPIERGRAVTVRIREEAQKQEAMARPRRRVPVRLAKPPADPAKN